MKKEKCYICYKMGDGKKRRKDIEISIGTFDGEIIGKTFCSSKCFDKYLHGIKVLTSETVDDSVKPFKCDRCGEKVTWPSYDLIIYEDSRKWKKFCSDRCIRQSFLKS